MCVCVAHVWATGRYFELHDVRSRRHVPAYLAHSDNAHLGMGQSVGMSNLVAGSAIGAMGERAKAQQPMLLDGTPIFADARTG